MSIPVEQPTLMLPAMRASAFEGSSPDRFPASQWEHPPSFYCPISQQCMHDPVVLSDGHSYERRHIDRWLKEHSTSPVSGLTLPEKAIFPNHALRNAIDEYFQQVFSDYRRAICYTMSGLNLDASSIGYNAHLLRTIDSLMQCSLLVNADLSTPCILRRIMDEAKVLLGAEVASVFLVDAAREQLCSSINSTGEELRIPISAGIAGHVATTGEPLIIPDVYKDARFNSAMDKKTGFKTRNMMCVPLKLKKDGVMGVVQLINKTSAGTAGKGKGSCIGNFGLPVVPEHSDDVLAFSQDDLHFLQVFASQAATAIASSNIIEEPPASELEEAGTSSSKFAVAAPQKPAKELSPAALEMLEGAFHSWQIDTLALADVTSNTPLSSLGCYLFEHCGLVEHFNLDRLKLNNFFEEVEQGYSELVQYHNRAHAASVLHGMHALLLNCGIAEAAAAAFRQKDVCTDMAANDRGQLETMACLLAAAVHDLEHQGLSNDFLVKTADERAQRYNDQHINENHHVAAAFALLKKPQNDFLSVLPSADVSRLRSLVIDLVLGTDMAKGSSIMDGFNQLLDKAALKATASDSPLGLEMKPSSPKDAVLLLQMAMKCADLGHLALPWELHNVWVERLEIEFFAQGDREKDAGLPVSFLMDRNRPGVSESQVGFFDFAVLPLFRSFCRAVPKAEPLLLAVLDNYKGWTALQSALQMGPTAAEVAVGSAEEPLSRKKRSGRTRQREAKFWRTVRARTPSPEGW
eukprot:TRINITY_DN14841_c0_g1_i1.p1 TRINITY_DN14841_c0_g1~~TRINITY_DN14841_c0_g1_i1.p1  ORF type:complete len:747 (+),score=193.08 TRINITY_DN14841_c0_g1_i1:50-2290(+)